MRIKTTNKLSIEDIPKEQRSWADKIITPLNDFLGQSIKLLNDGLSFPDNFIGQEHVFNFAYQTDDISFPVGFLWTKGAPPKSLQICSATEDDSPVNVSASWTYTQDRQVQLSHMVKFTTAPAISLLTQGSRYKIRVRVTP